MIAQCTTCDKTFSTDTFGFGALPHGLQTGAIVTYDSPGEVASGETNPNDLGGLEDRRNYLVIKVDDTQLRLGIEFTVETPGSPDRGARRLVVGDDAAVYYTADHYGSFSFVGP